MKLDRIKQILHVKIFNVCSISKEVIMSTLSNLCGGMEKDNPLLRSTVSSSVNCLDDMLITTLLVSSELTA